jgi:hypothetical protein
LVLEFSGVLLMPGGGADEPFNSDIGALLPIALGAGPHLGPYVNPPFSSAHRQGSRTSACSGALHDSNEEAQPFQ